MADVTIESAAHASNWKAASRSQVFISSTVGYQFYVDTSTDLIYKKTTDGGASWGAKVTVKTGTVAVFDVWYERWTPGDTGTKILIAYTDSGAHDLFFRTLDTAASDALSTEVQVVNGASFTGITGTWAARCVSITKSTSNIFIVLNPDTYTEHAMYRSTDNGVNWSSHALGSWAGSNDRAVQIFPGARLEDFFYTVLHRMTTSAASVVEYARYDNTTESWLAPVTLLADSNLLSADYLQFSAAQRHSDDHIIVAVWGDADTATGRLRVYDINTTTGFSSELASVITDTAEYAQCAVFIDQNTDDIYVAYLGGSTWLTNAHVYYKKSTDGGATWGVQTQINETLDDSRALWCDLGGTDTRFIPAWQNIDLDDLYVNAGTSVAITPPTGAYSLVVESSAVALVGTAVGTLAGRLVVPESAGVAVAATDAGTLRGYPLAIDAATVDVTATAAGLLHGHALQSEAAAVALAGTDVGALAGHVLIPESASLALGATDTATLVGRRLVPDAAGVVMAATDTGTLAGRRLIPETAAVALAATDAGLTYTPVGAYSLTIEPAAVALAATDLSPLVGRLVVAESAPVALEGTDTGVRADRLLGVDSAAVAVSGVDVGALAGRRLEAEPGTYALAAADVGLTYGTVGAYSLAIEPATVALAAMDAGLRAARLLVPESAAVTVVGTDTTLRFVRMLAAEAASVAIEATDLGMPWTHVLVVLPSGVVIAGQDAGALAGRLLGAGAAAVTITAEVAALLADRLLVIEPGAYALVATDVDLAGPFIEDEGTELAHLHSGGSATIDLRSGGSPTVQLHSGGSPTIRLRKKGRR